ncbi:MAG: F0F1 ATP synthase subunit gamma [Thermoleophilum sp.]|nr:F0F1 ATP synthase subunit gamma [Thermoleophilum sp.]
MASLRDIRRRIQSVRNVRKITRAMEMVAAARLRRAEQRIAALRPYADALRTMTRRAADAAERIPSLPILQPRDRVERVALLLVTGDRGLAGPFNSQILRAGQLRARELRADGIAVEWHVVGRRGASSLRFRGIDLAGEYTGFTDRPAYADARRIADELAAAYVDGRVDRVEVIYNHYISPLRQLVRRETLLPLQQAEIVGEDGGGSEGDGAAAEGEAATAAAGNNGRGGVQPLWLYQPEPEEILARLVPDYVEVSIFRALLESAASEHGARMTAMRNASENAAELIDKLTLQANRQRQAEITQEIMEVVAGAEALE